MDVQHIFHVEDQVFGSNLERIGTVSAVTPYYLHVVSGVFGFGPNYYVPYDAIKEVEAGTIVLKVPNSRISQLGWDQEPSEPPERFRFGHYGTMPAPPVELAPLSPPPPANSWPIPQPEPRPAANPSASRAVRTPRPEISPVPLASSEPWWANMCGRKLRDAHGTKLGKVRVVNRDSLEVSTGFLGIGPTLRVPMDHVTRCEGDSCYLNLTGDQVAEQEWGQT